MDKPKVVLFNSPSGSGKDFMCEQLSDLLTHRSFKTGLYNDTARLFGVEVDWLIQMNGNRDTKELPSSYLLGLSPRLALIHTSEEVMKPKYGRDYYGKALVSSLEVGGVYGVSDSGFQEEFDTVVDAIGADNVLLIRMFTQTSGFEGDSRSYIEDDRGCSVYDHFNSMKNTDVNIIRNVVRNWLAGYWG